MRSIVVAGIVVVGLGALMTAQAPSRDAKPRAPTATVAAAVAPTPEVAPAGFVATQPMTQHAAETVVSGSEPDPEMFDRAGLETWWATYQKAHPTH
jgi:hypothetical protein